MDFDVLVYLCKRKVGRGAVRYNTKKKAKDNAKKTMTYVLGLHSMQSLDFVFPVCSEALPGGQSLQSVALTTPFADEYVACGHATQASTAEVRSFASKFGLPYVPAPHDLQTRSSTNFPWSHSSHSLSP